jgi:hypothetical protein
MQKRVTISSPCHESWEKMIPNADGRYCKVCEKTVVDMTRMSQPEMVSLFEERQGNLCAMMYEPVSQSHSPAGGHKPSLQGKLKRFLIALLAALGFISFIPEQSMAQRPGTRGSVSIIYDYANFPVQVKMNGEATGGVQLQLKRANVIARESFTDEDGNASLFVSLPGVYELVARFGNQKVASRTISIESGPNPKQVFYLEWIDSAWVETPELIERIQVGQTMVRVQEPAAKKQEVELVPLKEEISTGELVGIHHPETAIPYEWHPLTEDVDTLARNIPRTLGGPMLIWVEDEITGEIIEIPARGEFPGEKAEQILEPAISAGGMEVSVYPNPSDGMLTLQIQGTSKDTPVQVIVTHASGMILRDKEHPGGQVLHLYMDLTSEPAGAYIISVIAGNQRVEKRIIRE